ncbi:hypothetical protein N7461_000893 [Penicillium sp. DV-2018c]|nr:hypothetical protein N7461_000893 [Penicillium sp. DV-2018c]
MRKLNLHGLTSFQVIFKSVIIRACLLHAMADKPQGWVTRKKIVFAPEKFETMHFSRRRGQDAASAEIEGGLTIHPPQALGDEQPAPGENSASSLRRAIITCVMPTLLYRVEVWYGSRHIKASNDRAAGEGMVSARNDWHIRTVDGTLALAARGALPVWRTTPVATLFRDAGLTTARVALEVKSRCAFRLTTVDEGHPLW